MKPEEYMDVIIERAKTVMDSWTEDEMRCYVFDRLVEEYREEMWT